jgi:hypothetical protein
MRYTAGIFFPTLGLHLVKLIEADEVESYFAFAQRVIEVGYVIINHNIVSSSKAVPLIMADHPTQSMINDALDGMRSI